MAARKSPRVAKAIRESGATSRRTKRINWSIDVEVLKRLEVHCSMTEQVPIKLIESLIRDNLKRFRVQDLGRVEDGPLVLTGPAETNDRPKIEGQAIESLAA